MESVGYPAFNFAVCVTKFGVAFIKKERSLRVRLRGECQPWLKFQPCFKGCVTLKVPPNFRHRNKLSLLP